MVPAIRVCPTGSISPTAGPRHSRTVLLHYKPTRPAAATPRSRRHRPDRDETCADWWTRPRKLGLTARARERSNYEALPQVPVPAIAHVRQLTRAWGHFVVLHEATAKGRGDRRPRARGSRSSRAKSFSNRWTGYLLLVEPSKLPTVGTAKPVFAVVGGFLSLILGPQAPS